MTLIGMEVIRARGWRRGIDDNRKEWLSKSVSLSVSSLSFSSLCRTTGRRDEKRREEKRLQKGTNCDGDDGTNFLLAVDTRRRGE